MGVSPRMTDTSATAPGGKCGLCVPYAYLMLIMVVPSPGPETSTEWIAEFTVRMKERYPNYPGLLTPEVSVKQQLDIIAKATMEDTGRLLFERIQ